MPDFIVVRLILRMALRIKHSSNSEFREKIIRVEDLIYQVFSHIAEFLCMILLLFYVIFIFLERAEKNDMVKTYINIYDQIFNN